MWILYCLMKLPLSAGFQPSAHTYIQYSSAVAVSAVAGAILLLMYVLKSLVFSIILPRNTRTDAMSVIMTGMTTRTSLCIHCLLWDPHMKIHTYSTDRRACMHTYIHVYIQTHKHTYIYTYILTYMYCEYYPLNHPIRSLYLLSNFVQTIQPVQP